MDADKSAMQRRLLAWYRRKRRDLPWRRTLDPYRIWLSEIMLQQTRVDAVTPYYERFVAAFQTVEALATAPLDRVLKLWEGLGYYARARNMHAAANEILRNHEGRFPRSAAELAKLPGVGRYTAAAVASIAFGEATAALDGNIKRVLSRLYAVREPIDQAATTSKLWRLAEGMLARAHPGDYNQAMMELGATVCTPRNPRCASCPLRSGCAAERGGRPEQFPVRAERRKPPLVHAVGGAVWRGRRLLIVQRPPTGLLGGLWELPGAELGPATGSDGAHRAPGGDSPPCNGDESPAVALRRILRASFGITVEPCGAPIIVQHAFTHRILRLFVIPCRWQRGGVRLDRHVASAWVDESGLNVRAFATMDRKALAAATNNPPSAKRIGSEG